MKLIYNKDDAIIQIDTNTITSIGKVDHENEFKISFTDRGSFWISYKHFNKKNKKHITYIRDTIILYMCAPTLEIIYLNEL